MKYGHLEGHVYCRYAKTPPIINSNFAEQYGVEASLPATSGSFMLEEGKTVKLRLVFDNRRKRMTCHAQVDWVKKEENGKQLIGFSHLSLSDEEFKVLLNNFAETPQQGFTFGDTVRDGTDDIAPLVKTADAKDITRIKAITIPVGLIEEIDSKRKETPFSEFVIRALKDYLGK